MASQLNNATILVNDVAVAYTADSASFTDGLGESSSRNAVVGGRQTLKIYSEDLSTNVSMIKFSMPSIAENINKMRSWKTNRDNNTVEIISNDGDNVTRTFTQASIDNDPEIQMQTDGNIEIEFKANPGQ